MTPVLSVEAVHASDIELAVVFVPAARLEGALGGWTSPPPPACVIALTVFETAEILPAASMAHTW